MKGADNYLKDQILGPYIPYQLASLNHVIYPIRICCSKHVIKKSQIRSWETYILGPQRKRI